MSADDLGRIEAKVDKLGEAIDRLVLIDERQVVQGERMGKIEQRCAVIEDREQAHVKEIWIEVNKMRADLTAANNETNRKLEKWINFGAGAWALAMTVFAVVQAFPK